MTEVKCTPGWEKRCRKAKWLDGCHCECGGKNHGADLASLPYSVPNKKELYHAKGKIIGLRDGKGPIVYFNTIWLNPEESLRVINHSPDGFEWGYEGSGPAQLALAIGLRVAPTKEIAIERHQDFKNQFLVNLDPETFCLDLEEVRKFFN